MFVVLETRKKGQLIFLFYGADRDHGECRQARSRRRSLCSWIKPKGTIELIARIGSWDKHPPPFPTRIQMTRHRQNL